MDFDRDPPKAIQNTSRHGVSLQEAATVFGDPLSATFPDPDRSVDEDRLIIVGTSARGRLLMVAHAERRSRRRVGGRSSATPIHRRR